MVLHNFEFKINLNGDFNLKLLWDNIYQLLKELIVILNSTNLEYFPKKYRFSKFSKYLGPNLNMNSLFLTIFSKIQIFANTRLSTLITPVIYMTQ